MIRYRTSIFMSKRALKDAIVCKKYILMCCPNSFYIKYKRFCCEIAPFDIGFLCHNFYVTILILCHIIIIQLNNNKNAYCSNCTSPCNASQKIHDPSNSIHNLSQTNGLEIVY